MKEESDFLKELFTHISKKIGRPYSALAPIEQELRKNWYDSPQSICSITPQQYEKMGIPMRVVSAIKEEIGGLMGKSPQQSQPSIDIKNPGQAQKESNKPQKPSDLQLTQGKILVSTQKLEDKLLEKYPWVGSDLLKILETLYKIIKNIVTDSFELKYRVLKKSNQRIREVVLDNPPVLAFLKEIGFEEDEEKIFLDAFDTQAYFFVEQCLQSMVENHRQQSESQMNKHKKQQPIENLCLPPDLKLPSSGNGSGISLEGAFSKQALEDANYAEMLQKLVAFRKKIMSEAPKDRRIRIYHKRHDSRQVPHMIIDMDQEMGKSDNAVLAGYWRSVIKNSQNNTKFQSRRKAEFQFLISQQVYRETTIKLRLPNQLIIEAKFGPLQTLQDVFKVVADIVIGEFYIYQAPPVKVLDKQMHKTLDSLDSVPCGYFYIGLKSEWYIKNEYFQRVQN